jgi:hypothetical protein
MDAVARRFPAMTLLPLLALLAGCAGGTSAMNIDFSSYAHQVTDGTVALYWNCSRPSPGVVRVEGVANNPNLMVPLEDLEFRLYGVTAQGYTISRGRANAKDYWINTNAPSPFTVSVQTKGAAVKFDLAYSYMLAGNIGGGLFGGGMSAEHQNTANNICAGLAP